MIEHRLTWRGYIAVTVLAATREDAIKKAFSERPGFIPRGTELHYGAVGGSQGAAGSAI